MRARDVVVVGASAGGIEALREIASGLPRDLPAAVFVALHVNPEGPSILPQIFSRAGPLPAGHPRDGEPWQRGRIYVAPPDRHLLVNGGSVRVVRGPRENRHRPAVDPLFRSAALTHGAAVVGVVLTGALDDGTAGLKAVRAMGGVAVVQDPLGAVNPSMPLSALRNVGADHVVPLRDIAPLLVRLAGEPVPAATGPAPKELAREVAISEMTQPQEPDMDRRRRASLYSCPECQGTLWEMKDGGLMRYRCHVGHAYSADTLLAEKATSLEATLWACVQMLDENADLSRRLARRARDGARSALAARLEQRARVAEDHRERLRQVLASGLGPALEAAGPEESAAARQEEEVH